MSQGWRYIATQLNGDGTETFLDYQVPIIGAELHEEVSGPSSISGSIKLAYDKVDFKPWKHAIYAEKDGKIRDGYIVVDCPEQGDEKILETIGFDGYAIGTPFDSEYSGVQVDVFDVVRLIWQHIQGQKRGNLGLVVDSHKSGIKIGAPEKEASFNAGGQDVNFTYGPYKLNYWSTFDLGKKISDLAVETPFDHKVVHSWNGNSIKHELKLAYPSIGVRHKDIRFTVGENVHIQPDIDYFGEDYASQSIVLGSGEGRKMVRGGAIRNTDRLRRVSIVEDKSITSKAAANQVASADLAWRLGEADIEEIEVINHPSAPIGSYSRGDEIKVYTDNGFGKRTALWYRILSITTNPETENSKLAISRTDKIA